MSDQDFIRRTFTLAQKAMGNTWPNPMVGAVVVKNGKIIGEGYHHQQGQDHAEVDALKNCSESPEGATIYVNLEPCCHTKKTTPPCAQRLVKEKIKKVVISNLDPNPAVNGQGVELLRSHGIEVEHGLLSEEGEMINEVFFLSQRKKRPFIHFKSAVTLDGKTAMTTGESQWITGEKARADVHFIRSLHQGIIVGGETVRKDNPRLNVRLPDYQGKQPWRIVFTESGNLPSHSQLFTDELKHQTLIYTRKDLSFSFPESQVMKVNSLRVALTDLFNKKFINLLMESGPGLAGAFIRENLIDRITLFQNPSFMGNGQSLFSDLGFTRLNDRPRLINIQSQWIGEDHKLTGRLLCSQD